jgi:hypothetical protein
MNEIETAAERINYLTRIIPPLLLKIPEQDISSKPSPEKWSRKEIIGHLIDSAANNHRRFIAARIEDTPNIFYNQDEWNRLSHYNEMDATLLIRLWEHYNNFIAHIIRHIPTAGLTRKCRSGSNENTLSYIITDYVVHLEHHLRQLVDYH